MVLVCTGTRERGKGCCRRSRTATGGYLFPECVGGDYRIANGHPIGGKGTEGTLLFRQFVVRQTAICRGDSRMGTINQGGRYLPDNLSLAYFNKLDKKQEAVALLEKAFALDTQDARVLMELDQLYKRLNYAHNDRLALLDAHKAVAFSRDDLYLEYVTLLNQLGRYEEAMAMLDARRFHPWEGGEGKVPAQYQLARVELAKRYLAAGEPAKALQLIEECFVYPHHLGEGKLRLSAPFGRRQVAWRARERFQLLQGLCVAGIGTRDRGACLL